MPYRLAEMRYIKTYADFLKKNLNPQKKLRVVFDCSNGTAGLILKKLIKAKSSRLRRGSPKAAKLKANLINDVPDGNFPAHGPNPLKKSALNDLQSTIKKYKADLGIIFDADGDRVFFADNKGRFINPDAIARLLIWHLKPKKVIIDARTGWHVKQLTADNLQLITSRVGHFFIKKLMRKTNADFAAEYSGHYYFKKFFFADSGILAAIEIINAISKLPYSSADFINLLPQYYRSSEINFKIKNLRESIKKIENYFKSQNTKYKILNTNYLDGLTMEFTSPAGEWWFNLRPSNTEPLLRLNIEAENKKLLDKEIKKLYSLTSSFK